MRVKLKRVLSFVAAVVICGVSCVTAWFSVPVSAIGVFSPFNFYQLYQMLHGLLLGDGGGNSQTFGEWLEKNMTRTIGSGNDKHVFLLTPGEKLEDMMSEASIRLALGAACSDGGIAGVSKMKDLIDSWTEVYDSAGDVGSYVPDDFVYDGLETYNGFFKFSKPFAFKTKSYANSSNGVCAKVGIYFTPSDDVPYVVLCAVNDDSIDPPYRVYQLIYSKYFKKFQSMTFTLDYMHLGTSGMAFPTSSLSVSSYLSPKLYYDSPCWSASDMQSFFSAVGIDNSTRYNSIDDAVNYFNRQSTIDWQPGQTGSGSFVGPVYAMPAAKQLFTDTGTLSGLRLDVQTEDGTPDISAALDHAGVDSVDDLVSGVAAGTIPMSQVYEDMRVVPYVLTDVETGEVVTDLGVSATDAKTKAVALDKTLSIPKDVSAADAYQVTGKTWDPEMSKYKLPLFQFFPFCLPWDIYEVLTLFDAEPVAPKFTIPVGQFFTRFSGSVDTSKAADQKAVVDLGADSWQSTFKVIRALECAAIIIGLCLTAVLLIHGGR